MISIIILKEENDITAISSVLYHKKRFGDVVYDDTNMIVKNVDHYSSSQVKHNLHKIGVLK